ncbi:hypothetical protein [Rhizorhabdus argentea]|uniref:hypothetical protein n=1 Tax=Rhizorhabdus argentea TaxID=1387174 RepID=UPI0030EC70D7
MMTKLTPEQLGDAGEDLFKLLCSQAQLIPNPSTRDRTGWDFRVEFQMDDTAATTLDKRLPRVCQVQVKSTAGSGNTVAARLSSVDRLAKDTAPAAIVVFRMRADGTPLMGYVIDLIDDQLARVLQRLRSVEKSGRTDTNQIKITFDYRKGRPFKSTPAGLKEALAATSPVDVAGYGDKKRNQLATLGFNDDGGIEANALVWIESRDHFMKLISGLAPLKPMKLEAYERRFDILLPYTGTLFDGVDEFPIQLPMVGACEIIIRCGPRDPAALFECEAFAPPPIEGAPLMVIRHPMLTAVFKEDRLEVETVGHFYEDRHSIDEWILLLRALNYLASGKGSIELEFKGTRMSIPAADLRGPDPEDLPRLLRFFESWKEALALAGVSPGGDVALSAVWEAKSEQSGLDILCNPHPIAKLEFDAIEGLGLQSGVDALFFNTLAFGGASFTFAVKVGLIRPDAKSSRFVSSHFELLDIRAAVPDLEAYAAEQANAHDLNIVIDPSNITDTSEGLMG